MEPKKNPQADLERKRGTFLLGGLLFAVAVVLVAFEWKTFERKVQKTQTLNLDLMEEERVPPSQPEPPPPPKPEPTTVIEVVEDEEEIEEELEIEDMEVDENTEIADFEEAEEEVKEEKIFTVVEDMPEFPGGQEALFKYLGEETKYPSIAKDAGIEGRVYVSFTVNTDGTIQDVKVLRSPHPSLAKEAKRVVRGMPKWKPGKQRGKPVRVNFKLPVRFTLN